MSKVRKDKEDIWIRKLSTLFPYGLCEKARDKVNDSSVVHEAVGKSFFGYPIPRTGTRPTRSRESDRRADSILSCDEFFTKLEEILSSEGVQRLANLANYIVML